MTRSSGVAILSTVDQVCRILRARIVEGHYAAGAQLRQGELATDLGVSHIPVREALGRLVHEGLVEQIANRGAFVAKIGLAEMREIWEVRRRLETMAVEQSVPVCSKRDLDEAHDIIVTADDAKESGELVELNWNFHLTLYRSGGNALLLDLLQLVFGRADRYSSLLWTTHDYAGRASREHAAILDAYRKRDLDLALRLMINHVDTVEALVADTFRA